MKRLLCWILSLCLLLCLVPGAAAAERVTGTLERRAGYDLASVRCELADGSYFFASIEETAAGYAYAFDCPAGTYTVKPEYFSTTVWDGAVDISWYDASQTAFYLDTPAKLAGLAALVNGQVDAGTPDYRIKGDRSELVSTRVDDYLLVGAGGDNQYGTVHVGDAAHDFSDKTVYLTADLNMGGSSNWTPIGGLYPMDRANTERVIAAYFNGTLDGQGHRITNLFCDRYAEKGYAYSQGVGLIGHMGDLYDGEAAPETAPAVRNLSVSGSIYGRRMVGGIVGRTGSIPTGIYLENCANHASVKNTDSKGVGGIVGAGWSEGAIVNCYNTGSVTTVYACPAGGICGSNGGLDIYNCYNVGTIDSSGSQRGRAIGGHNNGSYTVSDCYYLEGCDDDPASNGWYSGTALSCVVSITAMPKADMRSQKLVDALNCNGAAYAAVQGSYPVLAWEAERSPATHAVRITQPEGGTIAADAGETVAFGTVLHLSNTPDIGWAFRTYTLNGETLTGPYATVTADAAVSGVFSRMTAGALYIENAPAFSITVKKDGTVMENGTARRVTDYPVADGDPLYEGDVLTATATLAEGAEPENLSYVYNGKFRYYFTFQDAAQTEKSTDTGKFTVTSRITSASLRLRATAYTTHKVWTQLAETDWYTPSADRFTLTSARQLAGLAQLVKQGNSFAGKTVLLGADISLANDDKTFNRGVRWFDGIGSTQAPFAGTFDGNGYRITEMTAESTGSGAALFLAADGAVLVYTAYRMMDALAENTALLKAGDWTVYVLPCLNPDGLYDGYTNDGPGRCTTFSMNEAGVQTVGGVDMNRCFPTGWEPMTGKRNWNGSAPLACAEAAALAEFVREVRGAGDNICIDVHGWYQQTITSDGADGRLFSAFQEAFPDNTWADCRKGAGYFTAYTAELGYDSCLFEFPGDVYSFEGFLEKGYDGRFIDCVLKLLRGA